MTPLKNLIIAIPACGGSAKGTNAIRRAEALSKYYQVTIVSDTFPADFPDSIDRIVVKPRSYHFLRRFCHVPNEISFAYSVRTAIHEQLRRHPVCFILCHGYALTYFVGRYFKRHHNICYGMFMHGHIFERPKGTYDPQVTAFYKYLAPICYREADLLLALSPDQGRWAERCGATPESIVIAPNGIDPTDIGLKSPVRRVDNTTNDAVSLLYVGRFGPEKGVDTLLRACKLLNDRKAPYRLSLIGPNPHPEKTLSEIENLGIQDRVDCQGPIARKQLGACYQQTDILCVPSISEPLGNVVLEGMAAGCVVIASDVGGIPSMIEHGVNGWLVPPKEPVALADAIEKMYNNKELRKKISYEAASTVVGKFNWDEIGFRIMERIEIVCNPGSKRGYKL